MQRPLLILALLAVLAFGIAARLEPQLQSLHPGRNESASLLDALLGQSQRLFAGHFFTKADVYFHSGYYPSIFDDQSSFHTPHMALHANTIDLDKNARDAAKNGKPSPAGTDSCEECCKVKIGNTWIDRIGRSFYPTTHSHLDEAGKPGEMRELLPWLRLSAELDPHRVETFVVTSFWLRSQLGKVKEAEDFLREGQRQNPDSPDILFELGRIYAEHHKNPDFARNLWELALKKWEETEAPQKEPNLHLCGQILGQLARLEEQHGNDARAIELFERLKPISPSPTEVQKRIDEARQKATGAP